MNNHRTPWILSTLLLLASALPVAAGDAPPATPVLVFNLGHGVYWSRGFSNNAFIVGATGVVAFDSRTTPDQERVLLAELSRVTSKPITHVILSHCDGDHVNGLPLMPKSAIILATTYTKQCMQDHIAKGGADAALADRLPTHLVDGHESLALDGIRMELYHWSPAHTGGDLVLFLPAQRLAFTGDLVISEIPDPFMHLDEGGSPAGMMESLRALLRLDADWYVVGHGDLIAKAELHDRVARYEQTMAATTSMIAAGKSLAQIKQALGEPSTSDARGLPSFVEFIYQASASGQPQSH